MNNTWKPSAPVNPKEIMGLKKVGLSVLPTQVLYYTALGMYEGAWKYARHNYRVAGGIRDSIYYDATKRHLDEFWEGEDIDPGSGLPHLIKAISSLMVWADGYLTGRRIDDRPPRPGNAWASDVHKKLAEMQERLKKEYPEPKAPYLQKDLTEEDTVFDPVWAPIITKGK